MTDSTIVPGFVQKTYDIFMSGEHGNCCCWNQQGTSIIIKDIHYFSQYVLPKYFKHSNFQSFVRQLNMYDWHKVVQDPSNGEFKHPYFQVFNYHPFNSYHYLNYYHSFDTREDEKIY